MRRPLFCFIALFLCTSAFAYNSACPLEQELECTQACSDYGQGPGIITTSTCNMAVVMVPLGNQSQTTITCACTYIIAAFEPLPPTYGPSCGPEDGGNYYCHRWGWEDAGNGKAACGVTYKMSTPQIAD